MNIYGWHSCFQPWGLVFMIVYGLDSLLDLNLFAHWSKSEPANILDHVLELFYVYELICLVGLWLEKDWAARQTIIMASIGCALFFLALLAPLFISETVSYFNLALLIMFPILFKMRRIRSEWEEKGEILSNDRRSI